MFHLLSLRLFSIRPVGIPVKSIDTGSIKLYSALPAYLHPHADDCLTSLGTDTMIVHEDMITEDEERSLMKEIEPYFKRTKYESSHWDHAIIAYRETEKSSWNTQNTKIIDRIRDFVFKDRSDNVIRKPLSHVHVLDLAKEGEIKAHIDSVKFCGDTIGGLSLLSSSVMRLVHDKNPKQIVDVKLNRRSLYIMKNEARYDYSHAILGSNESVFNGKPITRDRRVSIIFRCEPHSSSMAEE